MKDLRKVLALSGLSLFGSLGTLLCCALPALLVSLGAGAVLSSLLSNVPQLIWLSEHKDSLFIGAALMLLVAGFFLWRQRYSPCPADPLQARACKRARKINHYVYFTALVLYGIGFFFSYLAIRIL